MAAGNKGGSMNGLRKFLTTALTAITIFAPYSAQAMEIVQYKKMTTSDQAAYDRVLWEGAEKVLIDDGRSDLANKVDYLYKTVLPGDEHSIGIVEFESNLALAAATDAETVLKDPNAQRLEVEHVMIVTLEANGIVLPKTFMNVGKGFKPKFPSQQ